MDNALKTTWRRIDVDLCILYTFLFLFTTFFSTVMSVINVQSFLHLYTVVEYKKYKIVEKQQQTTLKASTNG